MHRREYASWTLWGPLWLSITSLSFRSFIIVPATRCWPICFFRRERRSSKGCGPEGGSAIPPLSAIHRDTFANHHERDVGKGGEVSARAEGSLGGHEGVDPPVQHPEKEFDELAPDAGISLRQRVCADEHRGAHGILRERVAAADGVAPDGVGLKAEA